MPIYHLFLALLVIVAWGCNFIFIKLGLNEIPPLFLCVLRFFFSFFPAILFVKPPAAPFKLIALYGFVMFALQFSLLFLGMKAGMPPGLASILIQVQVFFSILFAVIVLGERPSLWQIIGASVSFSGIAIVALHFDKGTSLAGFLLIIAAAAVWGIGNLITKKIGHVNVISLVVWGSLVACFPLLLISLYFEGSEKIIYTCTHVSWVGMSAVLYMVYISTWVGYGVWNWLVSRYSVATIVPFTLLVPIVAMFLSIVFLGEPLQLWKIISGLLVMGGLSINFFAPRYFARAKTYQKTIFADSNSVSTSKA